ncbi:ABC transporter substrate-binding protein [Caenimonas aquaedulcis]|uniref:ABC transporter substrate-binding protein n=1 Tax=Caenimonas aquaedulcis TaxID=2793270 RepID=A0A931H8C8_9BURK|nr:ABC transporter substrate-binding protein [Caenimonas aquaedulcis]MBG9390491.1 ABC transporter substrate-binding protein [Caenimonas aquaedulcis]
MNPLLPSTTRRAMLLASCALAAGPLGAQTRRAPLSPAVPVRVGIISAMFDALSIIAAEKGYFRDEGLDVEIKAFPGSGEAAQALAIGALEVLASGPNPMLFNAKQRGIDLTIVATAGQHSPGHGSISFVMRRDHVESGRYKSPADLKGMKLASGLAAPSSWFVSALAQKSGVSEKEFDIVQLGLPNVVAGLGNKSIDAACINEPHATLVLKKVNGVRIMSMDQFKPNFPNGWLIYGANITRRNPEAGRRFLIAYMRALRDYRRAFIDGNAGAAELTAMLGKYNMQITADTPMLDFPANGAPSFAGVDELVQWHLRMGNIRAAPDLRALQDDSYLKAALAQG